MRSAARTHKSPESMNLNQLCTGIYITSFAKINMIDSDFAGTQF